MGNRLTPIACSLVLILAAGCIVREPFVVKAPPPVPVARAEVVPAQPGPTHVWVPGHWAWSGPERGYVWAAGHWEVPRAPGYVWVPGHWDQRPGGYLWVEGHWRPR